ncbi:WD40 repeat domain-containing protein [Motilimonas cestriensis]|uniref:WD40 repeat domain-containing protein n=1 Tax=Motilimonas cestriensis TaxID=2742685 RepID=UPI003DA2A9DC
MTKGAIFLSVISAILLTACSGEQLSATKIEHAVEGAYAADISTDGHYSVISSIHHGISLWDNKKNALKYQWSHQNDAQNGVFLTKFSDDASHVVTASSDEFVVWDVVTGEAKGYYKIPESNIRDIVISAQGRYVLYGLATGKAVHIDLNTGRRIEFLGHTEKINAVDMSANGHYALTGGNDYTAYFWDTRTAQVLHRFSHPSRVTMVKLEREGKYIFTADNQKQANIWDMRSGQPVSRLNYLARQEIFSSVRFVEQGKYLLTGSPSRMLALWDSKTGQQLQKWHVSPRKNSRPKSAVVYSATLADGQILSESSAGLLETWTLDKSISHE